jgi:DNA-binding GntR family transcriptional regulator
MFERPKEAILPITRRAIRTLPEQIADDIGAAITHGELVSGHRLLETQIAEPFGVSRGPVREAPRLLALRVSRRSIPDAEPSWSP